MSSPPERGSVLATESEPDEGETTLPTTEATPPRAATFSERLEHSRAGRLVIGTFLALLVGALLVINAPNSVTKRGLMTVVAPALSALSMEQGWGVFSPNPRGFSLELEAHVLDADGTTQVVPFTYGRGLSEYRDYRWQRWADRMANGPDNIPMWDPYCQWLAGQERDAGRHPVRIALVNRRLDTLPPGPGPARKPPVEHEFFAMGVRP
jgi:hypothetical protein